MTSKDMGKKSAEKRKEKMGEEAYRAYMKALRAKREKKKER